MSLIIRVIVNALALWAAVFLVNSTIGGISVTTQDTVSQILVYLGVGAIFGVVNAVIKPIIKTVGCLFYALTLGLIGLVVNALLFLLTEWIAGLFGIPFVVDGFWPAFWGALVVSVVSWLLSMFLPDGQDD